MTELAQARIHPDIRPVKAAGKGGSCRPAQMVCCSHPGCQRKVRVILTQKRITPEAVFAHARSRRWAVDPVARVYLCPDHSREA